MRVNFLESEVRNDKSAFLTRSDRTHHRTLWQKHPYHLRLWWHWEFNLEKRIYIVQTEKVLKTSDLGSWCQKQHTKNPAPTPCVKCAVPPKCSQNQFLPISCNLLQSMRPREKLVETKNIPRKISYKIDYSRVSLYVPISLNIYSIQTEIFDFLHVFRNFFANISRSMRPRWKVLGS